MTALPAPPRHESSVRVRRQSRPCVKSAPLALPHRQKPCLMHAGRDVVAVLLGVTAMLWWIFTNTAWPGFVIFFAGFLMFRAEKQRTKAPDASPDQHGP